jgi:glycosyltransferase involved in cell wall biosynthesis
MRIGIDYTAAAHQGAGIGRYTRRLVNSLTLLDRSNEYRLFVAGAGGPYQQSEWPSNVRLQVIPLSRRHLTRIWHRLRLPFPIQAFIGPVDLLYSPDFVLPPALGARTLLTVHDLSFVRCPKTADPRLHRYLNVAVPRSVARADHILADSENTAQDLATLWNVPSDKVSVLYPGVGSQFSPVADAAKLESVRRRYSLPQHFIFTVGTLQPRKNYGRLIEAFGQLLSTTNDRSLRLVVAGDKGWLYDSIFGSARRLGLQKEVVFAGYVDDNDLPALYSLAELFVFPSLYEGFGLPVLEAMACGTPVICSETSSLPEVAGDAALMLNPLDVDGWAQAMEQVLNDGGLRQRMVARGMVRARSFSWERAARELQRVCGSMAV